MGIYGLALLLGALSGGNSYTTPLRGLTTASSETADGASPQQHEGLTFAAVKGVDGLQQVVLDASRQGRPVMLDFYADWCISCKEMEAFTFTDQNVQNLLANAVLVQADVTANDAADQALLKQFDLFGPPGIIFYDAAGRELPAARDIDFINAEKFGNHVQRVIGGETVGETLPLDSFMASRPATQVGMPQDSGCRSPIRTPALSSFIQLCIAGDGR